MSHMYSFLSIKLSIIYVYKYTDTKKTCQHICICMYMSVYMHIYVYLYIERERERGREGGREREKERQTPAWYHLQLVDGNLRGLPTIVPFLKQCRVHGS